MYKSTKCLDKYLEIVFKGIFNWPVLLGLSALLIFKTDISHLLRKTSQVSAAGFEMSVQQRADKLGIHNAVDKLEGLTYDELKLFLIIGGEDADYYKFEATNLPPMQSVDIYNELNSRGLISYIDTPIVNKIRFNYFKTTKTGRKIHQSLVDAIYSRVMLKERNGTFVNKKTE